MRKISTSVRETAKLYCLPRTTLQRRSKLNQKYVPRGRMPILTENAYREVFRISITASSSVEVCRIAYEVALEKKTHIPQSWIQNAMAGVDWCLTFFKKYPHLKKIWAKKVWKKQKNFSAVSVKKYTIALMLFSVYHAVEWSASTVTIQKNACRKMWTTSICSLQ